MADSDLDYCKIVGRIALAVGDGPDSGENPDLIFPDRGSTVTFEPLQKFVKVDGSAPPITIGGANIVAYIDEYTGYLTYPEPVENNGALTYGDRRVWLLDLGSDKVNPVLARDKAAYRVTFQAKFGGTKVDFPSFTFHPLPGVDNDLTLLAPVPVAGGNPIVVGPRGLSIQSLDVEGGRLVATYDDGSTQDAGELPVGPGGSDEGVASYFADPDSATNAAVGPAVEQRVASVRSGNAFVALGDSISTSLTSAEGGAGYGQAWGHMVTVLSDQRINLVGQAGVAGNTAAQIRARVPDVIALNPKIVTLLAGHNDLHQGTPFSVWSGHVMAAAEQLRAAGIRVYLCTLLPRATTEYLTTTLAWNAWLKTWARDNNYDLLDFFAVTVDPIYGTFKSGYEAIDAGDPIHPSGRAHLAMAQYAADRIQTPAYEAVRAVLNTDPANLQQNAMLVAGGAAPDYYIPQGGPLGGGVSEGFVIDPDFGGRAWEWKYANPTTANVIRQLTTFQITSGFAPGDLLLFSMRAKIMDSTLQPALLAGLNVQALWTGASPAFTDVVKGLALNSEGLIQFRLRVPPGTTAVQMNSYVYGVGTTQSFTARVGEFGIFNLDA